jgi:hypothetical protein
MSAKEINLVLDMVEKGVLAVEKETNLLWSLNDLLEARSNHEFQNDDQVAAPSNSCTVTSLYPGCLNMMGNNANNAPIKAVAQTRHFLLFESLDQTE